MRVGEFPDRERVRAREQVSFLRGNEIAVVEFFVRTAQWRKHVLELALQLNNCFKFEAHKE